MTRFRSLSLLAGLGALVLLTQKAQPQSADVQQILRRYEGALPPAKSLAFFTLNWATDLREAKERARAEQRPIFFIYVTNITADTNFYGGHC